MNLIDQKKKLKILISPLDWGLGHASRCIPIIKALLEEEHEVYLGGSGNSLALLHKEFPDLKVIDLPGFTPTGGKSGFSVLNLVVIAFQLIISAISEYFLLRKFLATNHFDLIVSDNRYGLFSKKVKSIIITHQLMVKLPLGFRWAESVVHCFIKKMITPFNECWIPDFAQVPGLSGDLAHKYPLPDNARFIGPLSRFTRQLKLLENEARITVTAIISGSEPQRTFFEQLLINEFKHLDEDSFLICGQPLNLNKAQIINKLHILPFAIAETIHSLITRSDVVICRSGYSSIMDMCATGCRAIFIPTPGQTEQLYLAKLHGNAGNAIDINQSEFNLFSSIERAKTIKGFDNQIDSNLLVRAIQGLCQ